MTPTFPLYRCFVLFIASALSCVATLLLLSTSVSAPAPSILSASESSESTALPEEKSSILSALDSSEKAVSTPVDIPLAPSFPSSLYEKYASVSPTPVPTPSETFLTPVVRKTATIITPVEQNIPSPQETSDDPCKTSPTICGKGEESSSAPEEPLEPAIDQPEEDPENITNSSSDEN